MAGRTDGPIGGRAEPVWVIGQTGALDVSGATLTITIPDTVLVENDIAIARRGLNI